VSSTPAMTTAPSAFEENLGPDELAARTVWLAHLRGDALGVRGGLTAPQWACLVDEAIRHELAELTYRLLADGPLSGTISAQVRERLGSRYRASAFRNAVILRRTSEMATALSRAGIPLILLKGVYLARFVYPEPALRSMADVDLLVPRDRLADAERALLDFGFGPTPRPDVTQFCAWSHHLAKLYKEGAPVVELHWNIERPTSPFRIDLAGLWARAREETLEGIVIRVLSPEDQLLHLTLHAAHHHEFNRSALKALVDIAAVVAKHSAELDWAALAERANDWLVSGYVYTTLRLVGEILGTPIPGEVFRSLRHEPGDEAVVAVARRYILMSPVELPKAYLELAKTPGLMERWEQAMPSVFLPRESMERLYGSHSSAIGRYLAYLRRIADLLVRRGRLLLNSLFRTKRVHSALEREDSRLMIARWVQHGARQRPAPGSLLESEGSLRRDS
jgi:hypothetical protein